MAFLEKTPDRGCLNDPPSFFLARDDVAPYPSLIRDSAFLRSCCCIGFSTVASAITGGHVFRAFISS